jgi:hypothetical protein
MVILLSVQRVRLLFLSMHDTDCDARCTMSMDLYKYGGYDSMSSLTLEIGRSKDASF